MWSSAALCHFIVFLFIHHITQMLIITRSLHSSLQWYVFFGLSFYSLAFFLFYLDLKRSTESSALTLGCLHLLYESLPLFPAFIVSTPMVLLFPVCILTHDLSCALD